MPSFYYENKDEDLVARELKCHRSCYNKFRLSSVRFDDISDNSESHEYQEEGNHNSVTDYVTKHILNEKKVVSIAVLHTIYGLKPNDTRYRLKLKSRLKKEFPTLSFLNIGRNSPDVVIDGSAEFDEITLNDKEGCLIKAAEYLRNDIIKQYESASELAWPPDIDKLKIYSKPCDSLMLFYKNLLSSKDNKHRLSEFCERAAYSFASDLMAAVTRGKMITAKQYFLALGIHKITGQRKTVDILNRLGHCLTYNLTCEIETALAEKAQELSLKNSLLPIQPADIDSYVLTIFWVDNFDIKVETQTGATSVNTTHMLAFQENCTNSLKQTPEINIPRSRKRKIQPFKMNPTVSAQINSKVHPLSLNEAKKEDVGEKEYHIILLKHFLWSWFRKCNSFDQIHPVFSGEFCYLNAYLYSAFSGVFFSSFLTIYMYTCSKCFV